MKTDFSTDSYLFHQTLPSDVEAFFDDREEDLEDKLERATDDQLRSWLYTQHITELEVSMALEQGLTLQDIVRDQVSYGNSFEILD